MLSVTPNQLTSVRPGSSRSISLLVESIGHDSFGPVLAQFLNDICGADHFAAFRFSQDDLREVAASCVEPKFTARDRVESYIKQGWWKQDPAMTEAQRCLQGPSPTSFIHVDLNDKGYIKLRSSVYPHIRDRILLCGRSANASLGLSVLRSDPHSPFSMDSIERLASSADLLVAILGKHSNICQSHPNAATSLTNLTDIENCISSNKILPRREMEVCSRILYGISSVGIALDLSVSEETVKTYRKRAYQRLNIGSERELLTWYLTRWSQSIEQRFQANTEPAGTPRLHARMN